VLGAAEDGGTAVLARGPVAGLTTPNEFLAANVARALALSYRPARTDDDAAARTAAAESDARAGLVLVPRLVEELADFDPARTALREYLPRALARIDIPREAERWSQASR
jgi:hypothetical protein